MVVFQVKDIKTSSYKELGSSLQLLEGWFLELSLKRGVKLHSLARGVHNVEFYEVFLVKATVRNTSLNIAKGDSIDLTKDLRSTADAASETCHWDFAKVCRNVVNCADIIFVVYLRSCVKIGNWRRWLCSLTWSYKTLFDSLSVFDCLSCLISEFLLGDNFCFLSIVLELLLFYLISDLKERLNDAVVRQI